MMKNTMLEMSRYAALARQAVAEGIVLLKNEAVLPLVSGGRAALFGYAQFHYYQSGTGSGGLVNTAHVPNLPEVLGGPDGYQLDAEVQARYAAWLAEHPYEMGTGWAQEPWFQPEMPLDEDFVRAAAQRAETAFIVIGRTAGEDQDNSNTPGSFLLTEGEENMLALVCRHFKKSVVLLNVGNIIDMQWVMRYNPGAVAYIWQGGQEGCRGVLDVLNGTVNPCGKRPDTIACTPADYPAADHYGADDRNIYAEDIYVGYRYFETFAPEKVLYPFGFGLSYTKFEVRLLSADETADGITAFAAVQNTGSCPGKEVVQLYCTAPQGRLGKPSKVLCAFAKTRTLAHGESQTLTLKAPWRNFASYDDSGVTGHKSAFVLEAGEYRFSLGTDVRSAEEAFTVTLPLMVVEQLESAAAPAVAFERLRPGADGTPAWEPVPTEEERPEPRRAARLPREWLQTGDKGIRLRDVADGTTAMADFVTQFSDEELCTIVRGEGMNSPRVTPGTAGAIGGVSDALQRYGLPAACCSDGPSGIRMDCGTVAFAMPNGTCLAATFNEGLSEELYSMEGLELRKNHVDTLLGPGINIHRHPLNGRNFEYFSEDPLLTGKMACAQLRGMHRWGVTGTIKHFATNNQEHRRHFVESVVSERALREIYLRGFEIAVKEGHARSIMTSYNPLNGYWTASNYDLVTTILRGQWCYTGIVMSDWWADGNDRDGAGSTKHVAAMVRAQNDVFMVVTDPEHNSGSDDLAVALTEGRLIRGELQRSAANICRFLLQTPAFRRSIGCTTALDAQLEAMAEQDMQQAAQNGQPLTLHGYVSIDPAAIDNGYRRTTAFCVMVEQGGAYTLHLRCRAMPGNSPLAQIPVSIFAGRVFVKTITITGAQTDWCEFTAALPAVDAGEVFYLRFYFGQSGMELDAVTLDLLS